MYETAPAYGWRGPILEVGSGAPRRALASPSWAAHTPLGFTAAPTMCTARRPGRRLWCMTGYGTVVPIAGAGFTKGPPVFTEDELVQGRDSALDEAVALPGTRLSR